MTKFTRKPWRLSQTRKNFRRTYSRGVCGGSGPGNPEDRSASSDVRKKRGRFSHTNHDVESSSSSFEADPLRRRSISHLVSCYLVFFLAPNVALAGWTPTTSRSFLHKAIQTTHHHISLQIHHLHPMAYPSLCQTVLWRRDSYQHTARMI